MRQQLTESRVANLGAQAIYTAFSEYHARFRAISRRARQRFDGRDWLGLRDDSIARLDVYKAAVDQTVEAIRELLDERLRERLVWAGMKAVYSGAIAGRDDWELAETFFNSITRRIFDTVGVDSAIEFVDTDFLSPPTAARQPSYRVYHESQPGLLVRAILADCAHAASYARPHADIAAVAAAIQARVSSGIERAEMLQAVFYRNKGAYLFGRLVGQDGSSVPLGIALMHPPEGIVVDAVLLDENDLSIVFSFAHSYFLVDLTRPHEVVSFLSSIMPRKRVAELYISLGYHKHGKTELYRDLLRSLETSSGRFFRAPGERGMVMSVFTLAENDVVVKLIKDRFAEPKTVTRRDVMQKYRLVFRHDRAGRLVDAQEFEHLEFDRERFEPALLDELLAEAAKTVKVEADQVIIDHAYIERRVTPLDVYVRTAALDDARAAVIDFGRAIKDLAASNIFPGDFWLKNFGVTRHGRVVSYDYDELCLVTDCHFGCMPQPMDDEEALSPEPWFHVGANDVFPEEFRTFLRMPRGLDRDFVEHHAGLFEPGFWQDTQARLAAGEVLDIFAYDASRRLQARPLTARPRLE